MLLNMISQYCKICSVILSYEVMEMRPLKERISITIDSDLLEKLREIADADCRPLSQYINLVLKKHVDELESK